MRLPDDILIVGLGATGIGVAKFLHGMGKRFAIADEKNQETLASSLKALEGVDFTPLFGPHRREDFLARPMIVISPGVDGELPFLKEAKEKGIVVIGEMELAARSIGEPIVAITGTNGKTTVTTLMGEIFRKAYGEVFIGGNIGNPLINYVVDGRKARYLVVEVSSFQLETIETFRPDVALLLNITEDHLDRYRSYEEYENAKYRIFENQRPQDVAILNREQVLKKEIQARKVYFSVHEELTEGAFLRDNNLIVRLNGKESVYQRGSSPLVGIHNTENLLATILAAEVCGIGKEQIDEVLPGFRGLSHRVEFIRELKGVKYYNDSKATNVDASKRALEGFASSVILIAGGKDKGGSYGVITPLMDRIKALVLIGEAKKRIYDELGQYATTFIEDDLKGAVHRAYEISRQGDTILFSPMCSSFDMFRDYKERGNMFRQFVEAL
jgi:UDP-N-acetylmuramoylalanine--D-glutamate ligase